MTSPEWLAADEDDSDRFPQTSHAPAPESTHSPDEGPRVVPDPARVARHSVANWNTSDGVKWRWSCTCGVGDTVEFVSAYTGVTFGVKSEVGALLAKVALDCHIESAVADEERAALVEELKQVRKQWHQEVENFERETLRAEAAEAKVAKVEALFSGGPDTACRTTSHEGVEFVEVPMDELRAVLADAPAEQRAGGGA